MVVGLVVPVSGDGLAPTGPGNRGAGTRVRRRNQVLDLSRPMHTAAPGTVPGLASPISVHLQVLRQQVTHAPWGLETTLCCTGQHTWSLAASMPTLLELAAMACMSVDCLYKGSSSLALVD